MANKAQAQWVREIPEISGKYVERADKLAQVKARLLAELAEIHADEANLWAEIRKTGMWSSDEMATALTKMDPAALPFLPKR